MDMEAETKAVLAKLASLGLPPIEQRTPAAFRAQLPPAVRDPADDAAIASAVDEVARGVPVRVYTPVVQPRGLILYFHGGGFVVGNRDSAEGVARAMAARTGFTLASVDYRLAPEHRFPAAVEDAWATLGWADADRERLAGVGCPLVLAGESAGGALATVAAIRARDESIPVALQLLLYPVVDCDFDRASYRDHGKDPPFTRAAMEWFMDHYVDAAQRDDWRVCPIKAPDLGGVAPAYIAVASHDLLHDEAIEYALRLRNAGVAATVDEGAGLVHNYAAMMAYSPGARAAFDRACAAIRAVAVA